MNIATGAAGGGSSTAGGGRGGHRRATGRVCWRLFIRRVVADSSAVGHQTFIDKQSQRLWVVFVAASARPSTRHSNSVPDNPRKRTKELGRYVSSSPTQSKGKLLFQPHLATAKPKCFIQFAQRRRTIGNFLPKTGVRGSMRSMDTPHVLAGCPRSFRISGQFLPLPLMASAAGNE